MRQLQAQTGLGSQCGQCYETGCEALKRALSPTFETADNSQVQQL